MTDLMSVLVYLVSFTVAAVFVSYGLRNKIRLFAWIGILIPIVVGGFRYAVGTDYFNYVVIFRQYAQLGFVEYIEQNGIAEFGFFALNKISNYLIGDTRIMFLASVALAVVFFYLALTKYKLQHPGLVFFLFLTTIFPVMLNAVRQGIAVSIVFYAMTFIISRKPLRFVFWVLVASLFHISALLVLPFYFVGKLMDVQRKGYLLAKTRYFIKLSVLTVVLLAIVANVFAIVLSIPGFDRYELYLEINEESSNYVFYLKLALLLLIVVLARRMVFRSEYRQNAFFLVGALTEIILLILGFTSPFIKREALYFAPFMIMLLPNLIYVLKGHRLQLLVRYSLAVYGIAFFVISYLILDQADIIPYSFSLWGGV